MHKRIIMLTLSLIMIFLVVPVTYAYTPGSVQVTVKDFHSGTVISGAAVLMNPGRYSATTGPSGIVTFSNIIPYRNYELKVTKDGYVEGQYGAGRTGLIWVETGQTTNTVVPIVRKSVVQGRVTNGASGLANVMVVIMQPPLLPDMSGEEEVDQYVAAVLTDSNGDYIFPAIPAGDYKISAAANAHYLPAFVSFTTVPDSSITKDFTLTPGTPSLVFTIYPDRRFYARTTLMKVSGVKWNDSEYHFISVTDIPPGAEVTDIDADVFGFTASDPGNYTVGLAMVDSNGVVGLATTVIEEIGFAAEAHPSIIPGPSVLPLLYDNETLSSSRGTNNVVPGEEVYLRGWSRDFNLNSPELYNKKAYEHDNATWGLFDVYGNKNGDWGQSEIAYSWSLSLDNGTIIDKTYLLSSTSSQNVHFQVPNNASVNSDIYTATLTTTGVSGLTGDPSSVIIYVEDFVGTAKCLTCHNYGAPTWPWFWSGSPHQINSVNCEDCHGPGSQHITMAGDYRAYITHETHWPGQCGQCHDEFAQWQKSRHSDPLAFGHGEIASETAPGLLTSCYKCHYTAGFIEAVAAGFDPVDPIPFYEYSFPLFGAGAPDIDKDTPNVSCDVCHTVQHVTEPGTSTLRTWGLPDMDYPCQTCHHEKWQNSTYTAHGDVIGNAWHFADYSQYEGEYDNETGTGNQHFQPNKRVCVACHMTQDETQLDALGVRKVGGHTMRMRDVGPDGDPDTGDDLLNIGVCQGCHPGLTTFDRNGARTRIKNKLNQLGDMLKVNNHEFVPPFQPGKCAKCHKGGTMPFENESFVQSFDHAYTNYKLVLHDRSFGVHNPGYIERLLDDSITAINEAWLCGPDLDCNENVGLSDLGVMKTEFGTFGCDPGVELDCCQADIDDNGNVGLSDLGAMKLQFGRFDCDNCTTPCTFP